MKGVNTMTRTEMYKALEGKKVVYMRNSRIVAVGVFHKGRMSFSIERFKPRKHAESDCTTHLLQNGDYIEDLGEYILIRRGTHDYTFIFRA